ncbi:hypothetical protein Cadr_000012480, partial [Camelus dromedarius]
PGSRRTQFPVATASARRRRVCRRAGAARPQGRRVGPAVPSSAPSLRWAVPQRHGLLFGRRLEGAAASGGADASPARRPVAASGAREDSRPPRTCLPAAAGRPGPPRGELGQRSGHHCRFRETRGPQARPGPRASSDWLPALAPRSPRR